MKKLQVGQVIRCKVTGVEKYGIFATVNNYSGLIHISEISDLYVKNIKDYAMVGDYIYAKILLIDEKNKKLKLSIKQIEPEKNKMIAHSLESENGFKPLEDNLSTWTEEKINEYKINRNV